MRGHDRPQATMLTLVNPCTSSEPFGQVSNRIKRGSGPSGLKLRLRMHGAAGVVARWSSA